MRPKSEIYTPKRDNEHPQPFHIWSSPPPQQIRFLLLMGLGCEKHLKIEKTRKYYFKTIGYCSRTKVNSSLILRRFYATWPRVLFYSLPQSVVPESRKGACERGCVFCSTRTKSSKIFPNSPENCYRAITADEYSDLETIN